MAKFFSPRRGAPARRWLWLLTFPLALAVVLLTGAPAHASEADLAIPNLWEHGSFTILEYEDDADPDVIFAENAAGGLFLEKDEELRRYHVIFDQLRASALPPDQSASLPA